MADALTIDSAADLMLEMNLARVDQKETHIGNRILDAGREASTESFAAIPRVLMHERPSPWLSSAVLGENVRSEFIPTLDEKVLAWLDELRDPLLLGEETCRLLGFDAGRP